MIIAIHNLYHVASGDKAYYRKQGIYCFDFVNDIKHASDLTQEECEHIMKSSEWYCKQYGASHMTMEARQ